MAVDIENVSSDRRDAGVRAEELGRLCDLLDALRAEVALADSAGLHDVADRLAAYERLVRRVLHAAITDRFADAA
jgi:hypothetical protein